MTARPAVLALHGGVIAEDDGERLALPDLSLEAGGWLVLSPPPGVAHAAWPVVIGRTIVGVEAAVGGRVELLGGDPRALPYPALMRLRRQIGYVWSSGGLLSNRSVRDNLALPLSVHGGLSFADEQARVDAVLAEFGLDELAALRPHQLAGARRFACGAARAVILDPAIAIFEGHGAFDGDPIGRQVWDALAARRADLGMAIVVCLGGQRPAYLAWAVARGALALSYRPADAAR